MTAPAALALRDRLTAAGWTAVLTDGQGEVDVQRLGEPRGDGTRPKLVEQVPCRSTALRAHHPDGRAVRVVWETHSTTAKGADSWKGVTAWRGREPGEQGGPRPLAVSEVAAYAERMDATVTELRRAQLQLEEVAA